MDLKKIILNQNSSFYAFKLDSGIFHFTVMDNDFIPDLNQFASNIDSFKFIGNATSYQDLLDEYPGLEEKVEKKLFVLHKTEILYRETTGEIKLATVPVLEKQEKSFVPLRKKKVLIIEDSKVIQAILIKIISTSNELEVMGTAENPLEAEKIINQEIPDIITLDVHMPHMNGVEFLKGYLKSKKIPVVMITSISISEGPLILEALSSGALDYIQKPSADDMQIVAPQIVQKLETLSCVKIETRSSVAVSMKQVLFDNLEGLIAIGSSTGGTQALQQILTRLPNEIPPIVITQHIPPVFSYALASRLDQLCPFTVKEAVDGELIVSNTVYIAPGGKQFKLKRIGKNIHAVVNDDAPVNRFIPSVDYLFDSLPALKLKKLTGVILTGMGKDGAQGLLKLKKSGAETIAQSEKGCIIFGMPKEAIHLNAHGHIVDLDMMASRMVEIHSRVKTKVKKVA